MLIQRRPSPSTISTLGSAWAGVWDPSTRARAERLNLGFGRLGIRTERVVCHGRIHLGRDSTCASRYPSPPYIAVASRGVEGHGPVKPRQPLSGHPFAGKVPI